MNDGINKVSRVAIVKGEITGYALSVSGLQRITVEELIEILKEIAADLASPTNLD